jgi:putative phage-type endonuclease
MTAVLLGQHVPGSPAWHEARTLGIGGSEAAAVVGLSPWVSAFTLYQRKVGAIPSQASSSSMEWGTRLEPIILAKFAENHAGLDLDVGTYHHADRRWQIANPDGLLDGAPVDAKTADKNAAHEWGPDGSDVIPPYYRCQLIHYGDVFDAHEGHIALLLGGNDYREYHITWDESEAAWLRGEVEAFWQQVIDQDAPPLDGSDSTYQAVRELHPEIDGTDVEIGEELHDDYLGTKEQAEFWRLAHQQKKSAVLAAMGQARVAHVNGTPVLRRQPGRGGSVSLYPIQKPKTKENAA